MEWEPLKELWRTPDGSMIVSLWKSANGRFFVLTDSGKTYVVPKRYMNRIT